MVTFANDITDDIIGGNPVIKKGVVIMTNINLQSCVRLNYSQLTLNNQLVKSERNYNQILQSRLDLFNHMTGSFFSRAISFFHDHFKEQKRDDVDPYEVGLLLEILDGYNYERKKEVQTIDILINELTTKEISRSAFEFLLKIINHQEEITKEILNKELTIDRIEIVFNHLREVPFYLKSDLEINKLPESSKKGVWITNKREAEKWKVISSKYNFNEKNETYHIGA